LTKQHLVVSTEPLPAGQRLALTIEYNGACFSGWQLQQGSSVITVQGVLENALQEVAAAPVRLACAGRTDAGVHATNQVVHFDAPSARSASAWQRGGNANLPGNVVIKHAVAVPPEFHARFSARSRRYRYVILNTPVRSALAPSQLTWVRHSLDVQRMNEEAQALLGERDFSSFRAASCQSSTAMRHVDFVEVRRYGDLLVVDIQANAFLHHMVRNIVGALVAAGRGLLPDGIAHLLSLRDRTQAPATAPPNGLYLVGVGYPDVDSIPVLAPGPLFLQTHG
jgi:tRNA pseudouridine38-40 synthase